MNESLKLLSPDLQDNSDFLNTFEIAKDISFGGVAAISQGLADGSLEKFRMPTHKHPRSSTVIRDAASGLYIKTYKSRPEARDQFDTMNTLAQILPDKTDSYLDAVEHLAIIGSSNNTTAVAIIAPAVGTSLAHQYSKSFEYGKDIPLVKRVHEIRRSLNRSLGFTASHTLTNDIGDNWANEWGGVGVNIYSLDKDGPYTLIDQSIRRLSPLGRVALETTKRRIKN